MLFPPSPKIVPYIEKFLISRFLISKVYCTRAEFQLGLLLDLFNIPALHFSIGVALNWPLSPHVKLTLAAFSMTTLVPRAGSHLTVQESP